MAVVPRSTQLQKPVDSAQGPGFSAPGAAVEGHGGKRGGEFSSRFSPAFLSSVR